MTADSQKTARLVALFLLGWLLFNFPMLSLFSLNRLVFGIPSLYLYIFGVWVCISIFSGCGCSSSCPPPWSPELQSKRPPITAEKGEVC